MKAGSAGMKATHWSARITAYERSGLGRRAWCEREGVSPNTLDYWRRRLGGTRSGSALVPIQAAVPSLVVDVRLPGAASLRVSGVTVAQVAELIRGLSC